MRTILDFPHEILVMAFDYRIEAGDPTLRSLSLTCSVVSDAAMQVLYRVVTLKTEAQVKLFAALVKAPLRRRKTRRSSPLALVRCLSTPPARTTIFTTISLDTKLLSRVIDACPNLVVLQTSATVALKRVKLLGRGRIRTLILQRLADSIFLDISASKFSALERLHVPALFYTAPSPKHICYVFSASNFPNLKILSTGIGDLMRYSLALPSDIVLRKGLRALLGLPKMERVVLALHLKSTDSKLVSALQKFKDTRIHITMAGCEYEDTRGADTATYSWSFTVYHIRDIFLHGVPAMSLKPIGALDQPPRYFEGSLVGLWKFEGLFSDAFFSIHDKR